MSGKFNALYSRHTCISSYSFFLCKIVKMNDEWACSAYFLLGYAIFLSSCFFSLMQTGHVAVLYEAWL